jgi:hypothetical protein
MYDILGNFKPCMDKHPLIRKTGYKKTLNKLPKLTKHKMKSHLVLGRDKIYKDISWLEDIKYLRLLQDIGEIGLLPRETKLYKTGIPWDIVIHPYLFIKKSISFDKKYNIDNYSNTLLNILEEECLITLDKDLTYLFKCLTDKHFFHLSNKQLYASNKTKKYDKNGNRSR